MIIIIIICLWLSAFGRRKMSPLTAGCDKRCLDHFVVPDISNQISDDVTWKILEQYVHLIFLDGPAVFFEMIACSGVFFSIWHGPRQWSRASKGNSNRRKKRPWAAEKCGECHRGSYYPVSVSHILVVVYHCISYIAMYIHTYRILNI